MHEGQVDVAEDTLAAAIAEELPHLAGLPVRRVRSAGTTVAAYRIGGGLVARVPLVPDPGLGDRLEVERRQAARLRPVLPVEVPELVHVGDGFAGYDGRWAVWTWVEGDSLDHVLDGGSPVDLTTLAHDLAALLRAHRSIPAAGRGWSGNGRGGAPLADSAWVRESIQRSRHLVDPAAATAVWERALAAPPYAGPPVCLNGDPMPGNLILRSGRLAALVDIGDQVVGDPASDLQPAWEIFDEPERTTFHQAMGLDDAAWERGRGWAFEMAIGGLHYYEHSNPVFWRLARRTLDRLLARDEHG